MLSDAQLDDANEYGEWLRLALHERDIPDNFRVRAAVGCMAIAQDHHHAIIVLLGSRLYASVFALIRVAFEAYVRGEWLASCATDAQVRSFLDGKEPPRIADLLEALEKTPAFQQQSLSRMKARTWKAMCAYTHTGGLHVQRWNTAEAVEPNYTVENVLEALRFADIIASLSVLGVVKFMDDAVLAQKILDRYKARIENDF